LPVCTKAFLTKMWFKGGFYLLLKFAEGKEKFKVVKYQGIFLNFISLSKVLVN